MPYRHVYYFFIFLIYPVQGFTKEVTLASLQEVYSNALQKIDVEYGSKSKPFKSNYYKDLIKYLNQAKQDGNLEALVAIKAEEKRFLAENIVPSQTPDDTHPTIAKIHQNYHKSTKGLNRVRAEQGLNLTVKYIHRLEQLKKDYVFREDLPRGLAVKKEVDLAKATYRILHAEISAGRLKESIIARLKAQRLPASMNESLILFYSFDKKGEVNDQSLSGNHGKARGAQWVKEGVLGGAYHFPTSDSLVTSQNKLSITERSPRTISLWFYNDKTPDQISLFGFGRFANYAEKNLVKMFNGRTIKFNGGWADHHFEIPTKTRTWYHFAMVYDGSVVSFYLDGTSRGTFKVKLKTIDSVLSIGTTKHFIDDGSGASFVGKMDEFMIWKRALSEKEIVRIYQAQGSFRPGAKRTLNAKGVSLQ